MSLRRQDKREILIGLMVGLIVSAGVASNSGTPVLAFVMSAVTVLLVVGLVGLVLGFVRR